MSTIRVLFDITWGSRSGGTARYVRSLHQALRDDPRVEVFAVSAPRLHGGPRIVRLPLNGMLHIIWTQVGLPLMARRRGVDLVHCTMTGPLYLACPIVLTLHDALDFMPEWRPSRVWSLYMRSVGRLAARRASIVLTGTRASRNEIIHYYHLDPARVRTTPYGSSLVAQGAKDVSPSAYVLMVGVADRRKDIATGLRAVALLRSNGIDLDAVVVGSLPSEFGRVDWARPLTYVSDRELARLYQGAMAVLVPSRHEGFGLPVVESLELGTPVVASDLPALREAGGNVARYAPAGDPDAFARELAEIVADPMAERERVQARGSTVHLHTWEETAQATVAIYLELLRKPA